MPRLAFATFDKWLFISGLPMSRANSAGPDTVPVS